MKQFFILVTLCFCLASNALAQPKCAEFTGNYTREIWFGSCKVSSQINRTVSGGESVQFIQTTF